MWTILLPMILRLAVGLEPALGRLLSAGVLALAKRVEELDLPPTAGGIAAEIITGVNQGAAFVDFTGEQKRFAVRQAIAQYLENHGRAPDDAMINALIELGVQALTAGTLPKV